MRQSWFIGLISAIILSACTVEMGSEAEGIVYEQEEINIPLSFSVGATDPVTKMTSAVTQVEANEASFRGIKQIYAIPFRVQRSINSNDNRIGPNLLLPQQGIPANTFGASANNGTFAGLVHNNNAHLYKSVYMRPGTGALLLYGQAVDQAVSVSPDSVAFKRRNGVLQKHGVESADTPADISFTLEPFITQDNEAAFNSRVNGLRSYLNSIAGATVSYTGYAYRSTSQTTWTYTWSNPESYSNHGDLINYFSFLTSDGTGFSAGSKGLSVMLTSLYNKLYTLSNSTAASLDNKQDYYGYNSRTVSGSYYYVYELARKIRSLINNSTYVTVSGSGNTVTVTLKSPYDNFPDSFGVPAGCVAFQYGTEFVQQTPATGSALAPMDSYCYPPSLWYYTNSTLRTSDDASVLEAYESTYEYWKDIVALYTYGSSVSIGVESAAVKDPLNYGVGMLEINFNAAHSPGGTSDLLDSKANTVSIDNHNFPLTGVIIGEQKNQEFNFSPTIVGTSMYVYDSEVNKDDSSPKAYIAYSNSGFEPVHTLVVQTEDAQDVHLALEFQNNGADFYGAQGNKIPAGSKFYLLAILEYENATNSTGKTISSVFVRDRITRVTFDVNSFAKAYNTIPELRDPQLEIGVVTKMEWVQATPAEMPMY